LAVELGVDIEILSCGVGGITDSDVRLAEATKATILAFRVGPTLEAENLLKSLSPKMITGDVIYDLLENLKKEFEAWIAARQELKISGRLEVLAIFKPVGNRQVIGGRVTEGKIEKGAAAGIVRRGAKIAEGRIVNLQLNRQDTAEVGQGNECGILFEAPVEITKGDILEIIASQEHESSDQFETNKRKDSGS